MHTFLIKPTNHCNLRCRYCFIDNSMKNSSPRMTLDMARLIVDQIADYVRDEQYENCKILWHGGEPLLWGIDNYKAIFDYISERHNDIQWEFSMQTNLTLLNEDYIELFKTHHMGLGISMDGYKELHDMNRVYVDGSGSYDSVVNKILLARQRGMSVGVIIVVNADNIMHLKDIYYFFKKNKIGIQFNPLMSIGEASNNQLSISIDAYGKALIELFDLWINDTDASPIGNFIEIASSIKTGITSNCVFSANCQNSITVIEPNGDILPCDRLCGNKEFVYGNIFSSKLKDIMLLKKQAFEERSNNIYNITCKDCKYLKICNGGCPADNDSKSFGSTKSALCHVYKDLFEHISNKISRYSFSNSIINF